MNPVTGAGFHALYVVVQYLGERRIQPLRLVHVNARVSAGFATFSNLIVTGAVASDTLAASLPLNPALELTAVSTAFQVNSQTITFPNLGDQAYRVSPITLTATSNPGWW